MVKEPVERLKDKIFRENLWVFLFKLLQEKDQYAYQLRKDVRERFGFWSGEVTAYKVLYLLERDKYVESYSTGRKKYYRITQKGLNQLKKAKAVIRSIIKYL